MFQELEEWEPSPSLLSLQAIVYSLRTRPTDITYLLSDPQSYFSSNLLFPSLILVFFVLWGFTLVVWKYTKCGGCFGLCTYGGYNGREEDKCTKCHCCILGGVLDPEREEAYRQWAIEDDQDLITIVDQEVVVKGEARDIQRFQTLQGQVKRIRIIFFVVAFLVLALSSWASISLLYLYDSTIELRNGMDTLKDNIDATMTALDMVLEEREVLDPLVLDIKTKLSSKDIQSCLEGDLINAAGGYFVSSLDSWEEESYMDPKIMKNMTQYLDDAKGRAYYISYILSIDFSLTQVPS